MGPVANLDRLGMAYKKCRSRSRIPVLYQATDFVLVTAKEIEDWFPFKNLPPEWIGLYAPDNGAINVQLLLRTLLNLAKDYGAEAKQHAQVQSICPSETHPEVWLLRTIQNGKDIVFYKARKIVIAAGAYVNHVLTPSFGISVDLSIWEMVASYFNSKPGPEGTLFPSTYIFPCTT